MQEGKWFRKNSLNSDQLWVDNLIKEKPDLIVLAGFMRILSPHFINSFNSQIINLHPSLLPSFKGLDAIRQAWNLRVKITGCTVHWVNNEVDMERLLIKRQSASSHRILLNLFQLKFMQLNTCCCLP